MSRVMPHIVTKGKLVVTNAINTRHALRPNQNSWWNRSRHEIIDNKGRDAV
jgi:hypothetical protein